MPTPILARRLLCGALATVALLGTPPPAAAAANARPPAPRSMAAAGDSLTRGFNACGYYVDCPVRSFSTGSSPTVPSHYRRIRAVQPAIDGHAVNLAWRGARAADLPGQLRAAARSGAGYVTVLIGANDICAPRESAMTPVGVFRAQVNAALGELRAGRPGAYVVMVSIPDVWRLWQVGHTQRAARVVWTWFRLCQSMLAKPGSMARADVDRRHRVRQRVIDYNRQLAGACAAYGPRCRHDGGAVFRYPFSRSQISRWDYLHPNAAGQAELARISYAAGFGW